MGCVEIRVEKSIKWQQKARAKEEKAVVVTAGSARSAQAALPAERTASAR
jgi:hypothetical protein